MYRKHTRRAAKASFAVSLGVALLIGLVASAGAGASPAAKPAVTIGSKNFTEEFILGQLYKQALEAKGYTVKYHENIGSSELIDTALKSGKINFYPEYTGVIVADLAHQKAPKSAAANYAAAKKFEESRGNTMYKQTPFYDSDSFGMLTSTAKKYGVKTIGDMKKVKSFSYAGSPRVPDADHLPARPEADLRPQAGEVHPAREHQRVHAARPGQDDGGGRVLDRSAAPGHEVHGAEGHEAHLRIPERRTRRVEEARGGRRRRSRKGRERCLREADARRDAGDEQGGGDRQAVARPRSRPPSSRRTGSSR